jgi:ABC-type Fe3+-hydroxamate transport system substrate-binding protein
MLRKTFIDQLHRTVTVNYPPQKIVSLVPSQTELLFHLDLEQQVVGITKFCIHPEHWFKTKTRVGGTKNVNIEKIKTINPDLIIANKEENLKQQIEELANHFPVWVSEIKTLQDNNRMIEAIGEITNTSLKASRIVNEINKNLKTIKPLKKSLKVLYFIWKNPWMVAGSDTFINFMLNYCGFINAAGLFFDRYPVLSDDDISNLNPDVVLLSSEPYPFKETHIKELLSLLPNAKIRVVNGEMFSWYGWKITQSANYFNQLIEELE